MSGQHCLGFQDSSWYCPYDSKATMYAYWWADINVNLFKSTYIHVCSGLFFWKWNTQLSDLLKQDRSKSVPSKSFYFFEKTWLNGWRPCEKGLKEELKATWGGWWSLPSCHLHVPSLRHLSGWSELQIWQRRHFTYRCQFCLNVRLFFCSWNLALNFNLIYF